jgi:SAM-dependent methyltransferase
MASRAPDVIAEHVAWLLELLSAEPAPDGRTRHVLDLGCGPGLYAPAIARGGLRYTGIDFGPSAVAHARELAVREHLDGATFHEADLTALPEDLLAALGPVDVATFWFGEFNSFPPDQARAILDAVARAIGPNGLLVLEYQPWDLFAKDSSTSWEAHPRSVFGDTPHLWLQEHHWDEERQAEIIVFWILDGTTGALHRHTQCHQAYRDEDLIALLAAAGFDEPTFFAPITAVDEQFEFPVVVAPRRS